MTVEPERFESVERKSNFNYIAYCGDIGGNKDGVRNLIESFSMIEAKYPELKLLLIGDSKINSERLLLEDYAKELKCSNVVFYGLVPRAEIPELLCNARILALARPQSKQAEGGFPTKLGEYLSTGNPVVVTAVGDIPKYLTDDVNAFLVEPDNNTLFARKLEYVLDNYQHALQVASEGKKLVYSTFNYRVQAEKISEFIEQLVNDV